MAHAVYSEPSTISGTVEAVNPKGIKLHGDWHNWSKFATDPIEPARGQDVVLSLDKQGFVRSCELVDGSSRIAPPGNNITTVLPTDRERTITRLAVLKAAAEFGASRPDLKSGDVLTIADSWVRWVEQPEPADDDDGLTDAF